MAVNGEPHVFVAAGSDSSGGAGIARDIETIASYGLRACLAVTAVTVQTHQRVEKVETMPHGLVATQMRAALAANPVASIKIGMLGSATIVAAAAEVLQDHKRIPVVLDPVLASTSGGKLLPEDAVALMRETLLPLSSLVTPNICELARLTDAAPAENENDAEQQAHTLLNSGCAAVLIKGGHARGRQATDILFRPGLAPLRFEATRLTKTTRGTGCMLASAIAANLALGLSLEASVGKAKHFVFDRLAAAGSE